MFYIVYMVKALRWHQNVAFFRSYLPVSALLKREIILKKGKRNGGQEKEGKASRSLFVIPFSLPALRFIFTLSLTPLRQKEASAEERVHNLILFYFSIQSTHYYENLCEKDLNTERFFTKMVLKRPDFFC